MELPRLYSWRPDPEAENTDGFNQDWSTTQGFVNPPWCLIASQTKQQQARLIKITSLWGHLTMAPNHSGNVGGLSIRTSVETRFSHTPNTSGQIHHETGDTGLSYMAYLRESFTS